MARFWPALVLWLLIAQVARGAEWDWSPAGEHQRAVCLVHAGDAQASGVYVEDGPLRGIVTARHVIAAGAPYTCRFGERTVTGKDPQVDKFGHDLGFLFPGEPPGAPPLSLADSALEPGSRVEIVGFGGPKTRPRHWFATCRRSLAELCLFDSYVIWGDSGGAILDGRHRLAGIAIGGEPPSERADWGVYRGTVAVAQGPLRDFVGRIRDRFCPHGGCPPGRRELPDHYYPPEHEGEYRTEEGPPSGWRPSPEPRSDPKTLEERFDELRERALESERRTEDLVPVEPEREKAPILADHLEPLRTQIDGLNERIDKAQDAQERQTKTLSDRLQKIQGALALVDRLRRRVEESEERVGRADPKAAARDAARGVARDYAPGLVDVLAGALPGLLAALGWTGPPAVAAALIARLLARRAKRRIRQRLEPADPPRSGGRRRLNDDYAEQLAAVHALGGRSPAADATLGREYDRQLAEAEQSSDGHLARLARGIRRRVQETFYRIHDQSPTPGEPVEE